MMGTYLYENTLYYNKIIIVYTGHNDQYLYEVMEYKNLIY